MNKIEYIRHIKKYIILAVLIFLIGFADGYLLPKNSPEEAAKFISQLKDMFAPIADAESSQIFAFIFLKNASAVIISIVLGIFAGFFPALAALSNGFLVGIVAYYTVEKSSWIVFLSGILPHGIFELPAFFLSVAMGIKLGESAIVSIYSYLRGKPQKESFKDEFYMAIKFFIAVLLPLLFIAALVETYVTPELLSMSSGL